MGIYRHLWGRVDVDIGPAEIDLQQLTEGGPRGFGQETGLLTSFLNGFFRGPVAEGFWTLYREFHRES